LVLACPTGTARSSESDPDSAGVRIELDDQSQQEMNKYTEMYRKFCLVSEIVIFALDRLIKSQHLNAFYLLCHALALDETISSPSPPPVFSRRSDILRWMKMPLMALYQHVNQAVTMPFAFGSRRKAAMQAFHSVVPNFYYFVSKYKNDPTKFDYFFFKLREKWTNEIVAYEDPGWCSSVLPFSRSTVLVFLCSCDPSPSLFFSDFLGFCFLLSVGEDVTELTMLLLGEPPSYTTPPFPDDEPLPTTSVCLSSLSLLRRFVFCCLMSSFPFLLFPSRMTQRCSLDKKRWGSSSTTTTWFVLLLVPFVSVLVCSHVCFVVSGLSFSCCFFQSTCFDLRSFVTDSGEKEEKDERSP
jgi:hypothetical protein